MGANNRICRITSGLGKYLPKMSTIILTNNKLTKFKDLKPLSDMGTITHLSLMGNPVAKLPDYRLFVIHRLPNLKMLDFQKVKLKEREEAKAKFGELQLEEEEAEVEDPAEEAQAKTFTPGEGPGLSAEERAALVLKIKAATTVQEIEQLEKQLKAPTSVHMED